MQNKQLLLTMFLYMDTRKDECLQDLAILSGYVGDVLGMFWDDFRVILWQFQNDLGVC